MKPSSSSRRAAEDSGRAGEVAAVGESSQNANSPEGAFRYLVEAPIDMAGLLAGAHHPGAGAVVLFSGEVRGENRGKVVAFLEYEAHVPLATAMIGDILKEAREKWGLMAAIAQHRIGRVEVGETAVVVITASPHRSEAYIANRHIIDRIKHEAPIWKCEHYRDGSSEWGNNCNCQQITGDVSQHIYESRE